MILSIIGTRPQYVKVLPIQEYCKKKNVPHYVIDTNQHYSQYVSQELIKDLGLEIDVNLNIHGWNNSEFIANAIKKINNILPQTPDTKVLVYGDTNSTVAGALAAKLSGFRLGHAEAGIRTKACNLEETNRKVADDLADVNFCSSSEDIFNISDGVFSGDLEYELLNVIAGDSQIRYDGSVLLTLHRKELIYKQVQDTLWMFKDLNYSVLWPQHHSLISSPWYDALYVPENVLVTRPLTYTEIVQKLKVCPFIVTDSGGLEKIAPFFGKGVLVARDYIGWSKGFSLGYSKILEGAYDFLWASKPRPQNKNLYLSCDSPARTIVTTMEEW
jgi:UDP-GlcNAc3NAcA epimerase